MAAKTIIIDGPIGQYAFSKAFIRNEITGNENNPVNIQLSSLGGDVDHALNIYDQFVAHGNVTVELSAFNASAATIISLGAKHIRMNENSFYLIHKAMNWVDEWGTMNEDEISALIEKLEHQKQNLAKVTLQIAKMYVAKTGKTLDQILTLMKEESWLTAEETLEWGFVDEIYAPEVAVNYLENVQMINMAVANGLPALPKSLQTQNINEDSFFEKIWNRMKSRQNQDDITNQIQKVEMTQFDQINTVLGVESLESVDNYVNLSEDQLTLLNTRLIQSMDRTEIENAHQARTTSENALQTTIGSLDELDPSIAVAETPEAKILALKTVLASRPGVPPAGGAGSTDKNLDTSLNDVLDKLPHNIEADQL